MPTTDDVVSWLVENAPAYLDRRYSPDRCIAATRHGLAVCHYFGIRARPWKVALIAGNRAWREWVDSDPPPEATMPDEAWSVAIDPRMAFDQPGYDGHLVLVVEQRLLVDLSLGQASRPERGMPLPAAAAFEVDTWPADRGFEVAESDGAIVAYHALPQRDWHATPDWRRDPPLAGAMIRACRP